MKISRLLEIVLLPAVLLVTLATPHFGEPPLAAGGGGANGDELFAAKCAGCHGKDGRGLQNWRTKGQPSFADGNFQRSRTDAQLAESLRNGKGKFMPAWKDKLSAEQINALVDQVRAFGKKT